MVGVCRQQKVMIQVCRQQEVMMVVYKRTQEMKVDCMEEQMEPYMVI